MKATHKGTCQVCGKLHKVSQKDGTVAKHGYTVEHGYFQGACWGEREKPLQVDRSVADRSIVSLNEQADKKEKQAESKEFAPFFSFYVSAYNDRVYSYGRWMYANNKKPQRVSVPVRIVEARDGTFYIVGIDPARKLIERARSGDYGWIVEDNVDTLKRQASHMRRHAAAIKEEAGMIHGTDLIPV